MGVAIKKINCPNPDHEDSVASCAVYSDGSGFCFGCQKHFRQLEAPSNQDVYREDLNAKAIYIDNLPRRQERGLEFPYDDTGYYITWLNSDYYKLRRWDDSHARGRYVSPSGHAKPPFIIGNARNVTTLIFVEGEINALSLAAINPLADIVSPGGVSSFTDKAIINELPSLVNYAKVIICVDADAAGLEAAIKLKLLVRPYCGDVKIVLMKTDFNEILVERGEEGIKEELKNLGL